jgi:hypothetical protein
MVIKIHAEESDVKLQMRYLSRFQIEEKKCESSGKESKYHHNPIHFLPPSWLAPWNFKQRLLTREILQRTKETEPATSSSPNEGGEHYQTSPDNNNPCNHSPINRVPNESKV